MVREVGVEPTKSPRSERGAFTNLTTPARTNWSGLRDSNSQQHASQACASTKVAPRPDGPRAWIRTTKPQGLSLRGRPVPVTRGFQLLAVGEGVEPPTQGLIGSLFSRQCDAPMSVLPQIHDYRSRRQRLGNRDERRYRNMMLLQRSTICHRRIRTCMTGFKGRRPAIERGGNHWCSRRDSNPHRAA